MADEPLEPEHVEYLERRPSRQEEQEEPRQTVYEGDGASCCPACGCLVFGLILLLYFTPGAIFGTLIVVVAAAWLSRKLLSLAGVSRYSSGYVYFLVPVFFVLVNLLMKLVRGYTPYSFGEIVLGTLAVYALLWALKKLGRRR